MSVDLPAPLPPTRPDDLALVEIDVDVIDGVHAAEGDADVAHLDERSRVLDRSCTCPPTAAAATAVPGVHADGNHQDDAGHDRLHR